MKTAAVYVRVSTNRQNTANQLPAVLRLVEARGFTPVIYEEHESATKKQNARVELTRMMTAVRRGEHAAVAVWALDRLHRSMRDLVDNWHELHRLKVTLLSVQEPWADTSGDNPVGELLVAFFGWAAQFETRRLSQRILEGQARARAAGVKLGRRRSDVGILALAVERLASTGKTPREVARTLTSAGTPISERTLRRAAFDSTWRTQSGLEGPALVKLSERDRLQLQIATARGARWPTIESAA